MTPVHLPEVPEWSGEFMTESEFREAALAYATEAVMAERRRLDWLVDHLRSADLYAALYPHYSIGGDVRAAIDAFIGAQQ